MPRARRRLAAGARSLREKEYGARSTSPCPRAASPCFHIPERPLTAALRVGNAPASTRYHTALPAPGSSSAIGVTNGVTPSAARRSASASALSSLAYAASCTVQGSESTRRAGAAATGRARPGAAAGGAGGGGPLGAPPGSGPRARAPPPPPPPPAPRARPPPGARRHGAGGDEEDAVDLVRRLGERHIVLERIHNPLGGREADGFVQRRVLEPQVHERDPPIGERRGAGHVPGGTRSPLQVPRRRHQRHECLSGDQ